MRVSNPTTFEPRFAASAAVSTPRRAKEALTSSMRRQCSWLSERPLAESVDADGVAELAEEVCVPGGWGWWECQSAFPRERPLGCLLRVVSALECLDACRRLSSPRAARSLFRSCEGGGSDARVWKLFYNV